jgi:hypothetical protein
MMIDATYTADVLAWALAWGAIGLAGRELLARHDQRKSGEPHRSARKVGR